MDRLSVAPVDLRPHIHQRPIGIAIRHLAGGTEFFLDGFELLSHEDGIPCRSVDWRELRGGLSAPRLALRRAINGRLLVRFDEAPVLAAGGGGRDAEFTEVLGKPLSPPL